MTRAPANAFALKKTYLQALNMLRGMLGLSAQNALVTSTTGSGNIVNFNQSNATFSFSAKNAGNGISISRGWLFYAGRIYFFPSRVFENADAVYFKFKVTVTPSNISPGDPWEILSDDTVSNAPEMVGGALGLASTICEIRNPSGEIITVSEGTIYVPIAMKSDAGIIRQPSRNQSWAVASSGDLIQII